MWPAPAEASLACAFASLPRRGRAAYATTGLVLLAAVAIFVWSGTVQADSMRCGGQLVTEGDAAVSVAHACGEPSFRDPWWGNAPVQNPPMMEWTYNHGPQRLLQKILFRNGRVVAIRSAGYGFVNNGIPPSGSCNPTAIQPGMSKLQLLLSCGHPVQQTGWYIGSRIYRDGGQTYFLHGAVHPVYRERWIYNFGHHRLMREVQLENAEVVAVNTLERGFDPR